MVSPSYRLTQTAADGDSAPGGPVAASTADPAAATKHQLQTMDSVAATKSKHTVGGINSLAHATEGILTKIASDSSLGRYVTPEARVLA